LNPFAPPAAELNVGAGAAVESRGFKSLTPLARAIGVVMGLLVLSEVAVIAFSLASISAMHERMAGGDAGGPIYQVAVLIGGATVVLWLAAAVLFCFFMPRANRNLRAFAGEEANIWLRFKPGQTVAAFFIPIVNLYRPYQVMKELWQWSAPDPATPPSSVRVPALLPWWWGLYILDNLLSQITSRMSSVIPPDPDTAINNSWATIVDSVVTIASALLAAIVVRAVARRHELRQQRRTQPA
jgi:hypothetical protein